MRTCPYCKKPMKSGELCGCERRKGVLAEVPCSVTALERKCDALERLVIELTLTAMKTTAIFETEIFNRLLDDLQHSGSQNSVDMCPLSTKNAETP